MEWPRWAGHLVRLWTAYLLITSTVVTTSFMNVGFNHINIEFKHQLACKGNEDSEEENDEGFGGHYYGRDEGDGIIIIIT